MKTLIIAEKPSLAKEIQAMLEKGYGEKFENKRDFQESGNFYISSFFGHLLEMAMPDQYDEKYKKWSFETLPILPTQYIFNYKSDCAKRGKLLKELTLKSSSIINACDPDREGEGIFRIWYRHEKIQTEVKRLWATSLTYTDLKKAFEKIKPSSEYDRVSYAQACRSMADWLVGMNATRAYTCLSGEKLPIGRVKTSTLNLIVERDREVENYKESYTYSLVGKWEGLNFTFLKNNESKFENKSEAEAFLNKAYGKKFRVLIIRSEKKTKNPPKCYSQPDLQKDANTKLGFELDKTLKLTQSLYEKKLVTYPRTDSPYLPESDLNDYYILVNNLASPEEKALLQPAGVKVPTVKNTDASHTAIIPTGEKPSNLSEDEQEIYDLIRTRFVTAFMKPKIYNQTEIIIHEPNFEDDEIFRSIVRNTIDSGFEKLYYEKDEDDNIPELKIDEESLKLKASMIDGLEVKNILKTKPKYYTPATLLQAMINISRNVKDSEQKEILKEVEGIGTAATRQTFPLELAKDGYISKNGNYLISTLKGRSLIDLVSEEIKSPALTAEWEMKLRKIETGEFKFQDFRSEIENYIKKIVEFAKSGEKEIKASISEAVTFGKCPKCKENIKEFNSFIKCQCGFSVSKNIAGKNISENQLSELIEKGRTGLIKGFKGKEGKSFDAVLMIDGEFNVKFEFSEPIICPKCKKETYFFPKGIACKDKDGCGFVIFKSIAGKELTDSQMKTLIEKGKTGNVKGFKSTKTGKEFEASLFLDQDYKVNFKFDKK